MSLAATTWLKSSKYLRPTFSQNMGLRQLHIRDFFAAFFTVWAAFSTACFAFPTAWSLFPFWRSPSLPVNTPAVSLIRPFTTSVAATHNGDSFS